MNSRKWPILVLLTAGAATAVAVEPAARPGPTPSRARTAASAKAASTAAAGVTARAADRTAAAATTARRRSPIRSSGISPLTATLLNGGLTFVEGPVWIGGRLIFSDIGLEPERASSSASPTAASRGSARTAASRTATPSTRKVGSSHARARPTAAASRAPPTARCRRTGRPIARHVQRPRLQRARTTSSCAATATSTSPIRATRNAPDGGQDKLAVYRLPPGAAVDGAQRLAFDFNKPNGIALSPDGNTLYVVDNGDGRLLGASLNADGTLNGAFAKVADADGGDGMAVDDRGNLYVAATAGILVFDNTGDSARHDHDRPGRASNCTFGGS